MEKGYVLMHEHTTIDLSRIKKDEDTKLNLKSETIKEFKSLYERGVRVILDVTNIGMGRNIEYVEEISKASNIRILHCTGWYKTPFIPKEYVDMEEHELAKIMINELENGIEKTNIKASAIGEIGTSQKEWTDDEMKIFNASVIAHNKTGSIITTHTSMGTLGKAQAEYFIKKNINPDKVIIGHQDLNENKEEVIELMNMGFNVGFDTIGKNDYVDDKEKIDFLLRIEELGLTDKVVLSLDITRKSHLKDRGGYGYCYIFEDFIPRAISKGVSKEFIDKMLIDNPYRILKEVL